MNASQYPLSPLCLQDLEHVLRIDAENVGIEVEDRRQRSERLLAKVGDGELWAVRKRAGDGVAVATVQDAQALRAKVKKARLIFLVFWAWERKEPARGHWCRN